MLRKRIATPESGFTLIELLVVIMIIGILAAIALPVFLGQQQKANGAGAKSNARNMVSQVESCFAREEDYTHCTTAANLDTAAGLPIGNQPGQVTVTGATSNTYTIEAYSKPSNGSTGETYTITKDLAAGTTVRTCTPHGQGSCPAGGSW